MAVCCLCQCFASTAWSAPLWEQIYVQNSTLDGAETLAGFDPLDRVRRNGSRSIVVAPNGNFMAPVNTDPSQGNSGSAGTYYLFGSATQGTIPTALRREAALAGQQQETLGSGGIDTAGNVTYTASVTNPNAPPTRLASLWENDALVFREGDAVPAGPLAGNFFDSAGGAYRSPAGVSSWISRYAESPLGAMTGTALFRDTTTFDVLLQSGDAVGNEGSIVAEDFAISGNIRWSDAGTHYITGVDVEPGFTDSDDVLVINGMPAATPTGAVIREGNSVSVADGGQVGETWDLAGLYDINNAGDFIFSAFNEGVVNDSVLALNGQILHRENDVVDGVTLTGQVLAVGINDVGDYAFVWDETLFINSVAIAIEDQTLVDTDADGIGDTAITNFSLGKFDIGNLPAAGGDLPVVYVAGEVGGLTSRFRLRPAFADADDDDDNDGADLLTWQRGFGLGTMRGDGDSNGDGVVDAADLAMWRASYGQLPASPPTTGAVSVPEPSSCYLWIALFYWVGKCRR